MSNNIFEIERISASDFFYRNRSLAGFDNPVKATYTIVRELVENALDACELAGRPPKIMVVLREEGPSGGDGSSVYRIRVIDNGIGLSEEEIPEAFGSVFASSKYRLVQSRGTFGLGGTMAILYGQITTNKPFRVVSAKDGRLAHEFVMKIDIENNRPVIISERRVSSVKGPLTLVEFWFEGKYRRARRKIVEYLQQTAMVTPYADLLFIDPDGMVFLFTRSTDEMPPPPREAKFHPKGVDMELLRRLIKSTRSRTLLGFLSSSFQRVGRKTAREVLKLAGLPEDANPKSLSDEDLSKLFSALRTYDRFLPPDASVLSPLGPRLFEAGISKELHPEFIKAVQRTPSVVEGHPFIVETAIAYGGEIRPQGEVQLYRFANRIPLLYDVSSDVSYLVAKRIDWTNYGLKSLEEEPIALFVHIVSTKIPFKTVGKEYIANKPEVAREIELGLRECARALKAYLFRKRRAEMLRMRYEIMRRYYELIAEIVEELTGERPPVENLLGKIRR